MPLGRGMEKLEKRRQAVDIVGKHVKTRCMVRNALEECNAAQNFLKLHGISIVETDIPIICISKKNHENKQKFTYFAS